MAQTANGNKQKTIPQEKERNQQSAMSRGKQRITVKWVLLLSSLDPERSVVFLLEDLLNVPDAAGIDLP